MRNDPAADDLAALRDGATFDPTLRLRPQLAPLLLRLRLQAQPYRRERLFSAAARGVPVLFNDLQVPVADAARLGLVPALHRAIVGGLPRDTRVHAQTGASRTRRWLAVPELLRRWSGQRAVVSVTDLHVRGTRVEQGIDTRHLSAFNLLPSGSERMQRQEMMTLVIGSRGNFTDSHSDDPDGSNHCFAGRKLWLAWDTFEGQRAGLQDCERELVRAQARFSLQAFCSLRSARWWTVGPGQTLWLPGSMTHKVVTLEHYLGIGSFYVTPASCLESLSRWYTHGALWSREDPLGDNEGLVDEIALAMAARLKRLRAATPATQQRWGLDFAALALQQWARRWPRAQREKLRRRASFARVLEALDLCPAQ